MEEEFDDGFFSMHQLLDEEMQQNSDYEAELEFMAPGQHEQIVRKQKPQLTIAKKREIVDEMLKLMHNGSLPRGALARFARHFGIHKSTTTRLFQEICRQLAEGTIIDVRSKKLGKCGRKARQYSEEWLQSIPLYLRTTERSYAAALGISHVTLHTLKKKGILRTHTSTNKPRLTSDHKIARLRWVLNHIQPATATTNPTFEDMSNMIHIDEKWLYINPETRRFYLLPKEEDPYRCQQSRRFKIKVMFMGIIGKPLYDAQCHLIHDGNISLCISTNGKEKK
ncbi:uncharacterized protein LOC110708947 [Chenopodium quinoa]|uniref:uncharacterized protein LOC110708947 n=1 Tax=Chenopodium quinoa TaxID=63459 RepID=UPI000B783A8B|nr:uncharacterized protein LOC110708947 [Chenopodium quinoa]